MERARNSGSVPSLFELAKLEIESTKHETNSKIKIRMTETGGDAVWQRRFSL
jgi:hypothetical protein